jgi:hypothetical protein
MALCALWLKYNDAAVPLHIRMPVRLVSFVRSSPTGGCYLSSTAAFPQKQVYSGDNTFACSLLPHQKQDVSESYARLCLSPIRHRIPVSRSMEGAFPLLSHSHQIRRGEIRPRDPARAGVRPGLLAASKRRRRSRTKAAQS